MTFYNRSITEWKQLERKEKELDDRMEKIRVRVFNLNPEIEEEDRKREELALEFAWWWNEKARIRVKKKALRRYLMGGNEKPIHSLLIP